MNDPLKWMVPSFVVICLVLLAPALFMEANGQQQQPAQAPGWTVGYNKPKVAFGVKLMQIKDYEDPYLISIETGEAPPVLFKDGEPRAIVIQVDGKKYAIALNPILEEVKGEHAGKKP